MIKLTALCLTLLISGCDINKAIYCPPMAEGGVWGWTEFSVSNIVSIENGVVKTRSERHEARVKCVPMEDTAPPATSKEEPI